MFLVRDARLVAPRDNRLLCTPPVREGRVSLWPSIGDLDSCAPSRRRSAARRAAMDGCRHRGGLPGQLRLLASGGDRSAVDLEDRDLAVGVVAGTTFPDQQESRKRAPTPDPCAVLSKGSPQRSQRMFSKYSNWAQYWHSNRSMEGSFRLVGGVPLAGRVAFPSARSQPVGVALIDQVARAVSASSRSRTAIASSRICRVRRAISSRDTVRARRASA